MIHAEKKPLQLLILALIVVQPLLDVMSYWLNVGGAENTLTLSLRLGLLLLTVVLGFCLAEKRRAYYIMAAVLLLLTLGHVLACKQYGYADPVRDLTNLVRIYLLPLTALSFCTLLRRFPKLRQKIFGALTLCLGLILAVELLATVTGTDPHTYANKSIGLLGWFFTTSSQSAILCMLVPVAVVYVCKKFTNPLPGMLTALIGLTMLFLFATRLAMLGCLITGASLGICLLLHKKRLQGIWLMVLAVIFALLIPLSPMTKNQRLVQENAVLKQQDIDQLIARDQLMERKVGRATNGQLEQKTNQSSEASPERKLRSAYETYLPGLVEQFGLSRTAEAYNYSQSASDICAPACAWRCPQHWYMIRKRWC